MGGKQKPEIRAWQKKWVIVILVLFAVSIAMMFVLPMVGFTGLFIWVVLNIAYWAMLGAKKRSAERNALENGIDWDYTPMIKVSKSPINVDTEAPSNFVHAEKTHNS